MPFDLPALVRYIVHMGKDLERRYRETLHSLNLAEVSRETGRALRTLHSYLRRARRITDPAVRELIEYLRAESDTFTAAAERMEAALDEEGWNG